MSEETKAKVLTLYERNYRAAGPTLHAVADEIEALEAAGCEVEVALVVRGEVLKIYGMGCSDAGTTHILLACGQRELENAVLERFSESV